MNNTPKSESFWGYDFIIKRALRFARLVCGYRITLHGTPFIKWRLQFFRQVCFLWGDEYRPFRIRHGI